MKLRRQCAECAGEGLLPNQNPAEMPPTCSRCGGSGWVDAPDRAILIENPELAVDLMAEMAYEIERVYGLSRWPSWADADDTVRIFWRKSVRPLLRAAARGQYGGP